jgi:hypothetical protein
MQWAILQLSKFLRCDQIAMCVGVSERSIRRVISHFWVHGTIEGDKSVQEEHKQNRHLRDVDIEVRVFTVTLKFEITSLPSSSYLGLSINNQICTLMN